MTETGTHAAFRCIQGERWRRRWSTWRQIDQKWGWRDTIIDGNGKEHKIDLIEKWYHSWWHKGRDASGQHSRP